MSDDKQLTKPFANYPHTRWAGPMLFIAGQGCRNPEDDSYPGTVVNDRGQVTDYDIVAQTNGVFANIKRALESETLVLADLADVTVFLCHMEDFDGMNLVWNQTFADLAAPTRTTVAVRCLPGHNKVEMKAVAFRNENQ